MKKLQDTTSDTATIAEDDYTAPTPWDAKQSDAGTETDSVPLEAIVKLTEKFIQIPSVSKDAEKAVEILQLAKEHLPEHTFTPYSSHLFPSLLYSNQNTNKFKVILNAHLDIVPGEPSQYISEIADGKLYGRGAYDMKGAAAVMIYLFDELADQVDYPLGLQLVTDEELAEGYCTKDQLDRGVRTELAIIGECGSNLDIIHETKGLIHAKLHTTGHSAHGAYLWRGSNAILKMYEAINILQEHYPLPEKETKETTINVSRIATTNETWNLVPDNCTASLDIRYNKKDSGVLLDKIKALLPEGVTIEIDKTRNAHFTDPDSANIQLLRKIGKEYLGHDLSVRSTFGGSDTTFFSDVGCDAVEFGPVGGGQHDSKEWVNIQGLADYYQILKKFLLSIK
jgi:succinyl-diaminopimelate desuccinylase